MNTFFCLIQKHTFFDSCHKDVDRCQKLFPKVKKSFFFPSINISALFIYFFYLFRFFYAFDILTFRGFALVSMDWMNFYRCLCLLQCSAQVNVDTLEVTMSGLAAGDTDVYRCVTELLFPPPYIRFHANATLVHVIGKKKKNTSQYAH